jgi:hypothetical protein
MALELDRVRVFDVLRNALTGELALVMRVTGINLELRDKTGATASFKFGAHFSLASEDDAIAFRAALRALRKEQAAAPGARKRRPVKTVDALLRRIGKKPRA